MIVDILSFSTTIGIAVDRGAEALVYSGGEIEVWGGRESIARDLRAEIIGKGRVASGSRFTLSPDSLGSIGPDDRVIFTSWNGAGCVAAASISPAVLIGCLTNRRAVAEFAAKLLGESTTDGRQCCTIIAAAEHWSSSAAGETGIRPALEDHFGAGAIAQVLAELGCRLSVEAELAVALFSAGAHDVGDVLSRSVSGRELIARGFAADVTHAAQLDTMTSVPCWLAGDPPRTFSDHRSRRS